MKVVLFVIIGLLVALGVAGALLPKTCSIQTSTTVNASLDETFDYTKLIKNQEEYSVWLMMDPSVKMTYQGTDGTIGFVSARESDKRDVGVGEQEIISIIENQRIDVEIRFKKPMESIATASMLFYDEGENTTRITDTFVTKTPFPTNLFTPFFKGMIRKDMQTNLDNIKKILEK